MIWDPGGYDSFNMAAAAVAAEPASRTALRRLRGGEKIRVRTCADLWDSGDARTSIGTYRFTYTGQVYGVRLFVKQTAYRLRGELYYRSIWIWEQGSVVLPTTRYGAQQGNGEILKLVLAEQAVDTRYI
jgi:hypothetical protein